MESLVKALFDFDKLTSKLFLIILILSSIILFVPIEWLIKIKLEFISKTYGHWAGWPLMIVPSITYVL